MEDRGIFRRVGQIVALSLWISSAALAEESFLDKVIRMVRGGQTMLDPAEILSQAAMFEARAMFKKICSAQARYILEDQPSADGRLRPRQFATAEATPREIPRNEAVHADWSGSGWKALGIFQTQPVRFRYSVRAEGEEDHSRFVAMAEADLRGDGKVVTLKVNGRLDPNAGPLCGDVELK